MATSPPRSLDPLQKQTPRRGAWRKVRRVPGAILHPLHASKEKTMDVECGNDTGFLVAVSDVTDSFVAAVTGQNRNLLDSNNHRSREAQIYLLYLRRSLQAVPASSFVNILSELDPSRPLPFERILNLMAKIARTVRAKPRDGIDKLAESLRESDELDPDSLSTPERVAYTHQILFCLLGFIHMLYLPVWQPPGTQDVQEEPQLNIESEGASCLRETSQPVKFGATRPFQALRLRFGPILPSVRNDLEPQPPGGKDSRTLLVSNLNADALLNVGKINICWVHTMSSHLDFSEATRELKLFAFPSFCKLHSSSPDTVVASMFNGLHIDLNPSPSQSEVRCSDYMNEIILSYHLLFGDYRASRSVYKSTEKKRVKALRGFRDPLLDELCRLEDAEPAELPRSGSVSYSVEFHFPIFASRLLHLQSFMVAQSPKGFWGLWKDQRDLNRWVGIWAATILGSISIILALAQIIIGALSVHFAKKAAE